MSLIKRLFLWFLSGTRAWILLILSVFLLLALVYDNLVISTVNPNEHVLPNQTAAAKTTPSHIAEKADAESKADAELEADTKKDGFGLDAYFDSIMAFDPLEGIENTTVILPTVEYVIKPGDTLARIFSRLGFTKKSLYEILEADQEYLVLEPLMPKDKFTFQLNESGELLKITRQIDISKNVSYVQHEGGGFFYTEDTKPISYQYEAFHSKVAGNFYNAAKRTGLSDTQIMLVQDVLKGRVDFRKDVRSGDSFNVVLRRGYIEGIPIGNSQLEALEMNIKGQVYRAFLHSDGRFYDQQGNSLTPSLLRWPTRKEYRISSAFNANRLHPITGHRAPHNGVDRATPIGTEVLAVADGVVTRVATHKYAGKFVVIEYTGPYSSRFLHLDRVLVKKGQQVKRGQVVALSGNTGRSTGAHLHYELHIKGRPVNPMTADIPTTQSISDESRAEYESTVQRWIAMMAKVEEDSHKNMIMLEKSVGARSMEKQTQSFLVIR